MTLIPAILKIDAETLISELKRLSPPKGRRSASTGNEEEPMMEDCEVNGNGHAECDRNIDGEDDAAADDVDDDEGDEDTNEKEEAVDDSPSVLPKSHRSKTLERLCDLLTAQQMALEILTNICSAAGKNDYRFPFG